MTTTGEQPKAETPVHPIGERSQFDWKATTVAVTLAFMAGTAHVRIGSGEKETGELKTDVAACLAQVQTLRENTATKADVKEIAAALNNLALEFAKLNASLGAAGNRRAVYSPPRGPGQ